MLSRIQKYWFSIRPGPLRTEKAGQETGSGPVALPLRRHTPTSLAKAAHEHTPQTPPASIFVFAEDTQGGHGARHQSKKENTILRAGPPPSPKRSDTPPGGLSPPPGPNPLAREGGPVKMVRRGLKSGSESVLESISESSLKSDFRSDSESVSE